MLSEGQDRQRDHDGDQASPHTDILVRKHAGVKKQTPRKQTPAWSSMT